MRRVPLILAGVFLAGFFILRWWLAPPPSPVLGCVGDSAVMAVGRSAVVYGPEGFSKRVQFPRPPRLILEVSGSLAFVPRGSNELWVSRADEWERTPPPVASRGEGVWTASDGNLFYLPPRSGLVSLRPRGETAWRPFLAEGEELENPTALSARGEKLVLLNRDPPEAAVFGGSGKSEVLVDLNRNFLWPLQRPVFERLSDYFRPRRPETPIRVLPGPDGRLAVLFATAEGDGARLVIFSWEGNRPRGIKEPILPLRSENLRKGVHLADFTWLPDGSLVLTSSAGGLWRLGPEMTLKKEWEKPTSLPSKSVRRLRRAAPWFSLVLALAALLGSAWPSSHERNVSRPIPRRAWARGTLSFLLPGWGQALQRRWGWAFFWIACFISWGGLCLFLTLRLREGGVVTPATYIETILGMVGSCFFSGLQAFWKEWMAPENGPAA